MATCVGQHVPVFLPGEPPNREAWQATVYRSQIVGRDGSNPASAMMQDYILAVAALPQGELSVKMAQLLGLQGPWRCQVYRDMDYLHHRSYGHIRVFLFEPLVAGVHKASLAILSPQLCPFRQSLAWGPSLLFGLLGT